MKSVSLAEKLGLKVGLLSAMLLFLFACLGYLMLGQALENSAREDLNVKMTGLAHNLAAIDSVAEIDAGTHHLVDLVLGHDNLHVSIFKERADEPLLVIGSWSIGRQVRGLAVADLAQRHEWRDDQGRPLLSVSRLLSLGDGSRVAVYLTLDQSASVALLKSMLAWALLASPFMLAMLLGIAWWTVRRGLLPLSRFLGVASRISTESLEHRLPVQGLPRELKSLAEGINIMLGRLDDGVRQLSQFSDDLAHELRAPLTNLTGKVQVTLSRGRSGEEYRETLESCAEELERMARMVADMLFLANVSNPAAGVAFETVVLVDEAQRVCDLFGLPAEEAGIDLHISGSADGVRGNRLMIQRALSNLLSNALRYCPAGRAVLVRVRRVDCHVCVSVGNPGAGIAAEHRQHLFERFYRADQGRARSEGGTGLGLAIVQSIMGLHRGSAVVEVCADDFTWFHLRFPDNETL
ncbi:heavy metal sensor histidine kinase [Pseudomonas sp. 148P]|uniref:Sensor protein n=1 Tax=Pseudomonas ulcerans TaxID=3115852 RepID=A0ABU7HQB2_9PSED|nr:MULTISPECIES: heavy metal sensor histidine kinase [unclassified Pseudomonas]MEE1922749.1 heavy metal sensor histidine kinase [Pseudomonas sp. 147P]MEE1933726.1 heavy metal sensor histidine kinase [Pseudomonas sp. 148P]